MKTTKMLSVELIHFTKNTLGVMFLPENPKLKKCS